MKDFLSKNGFSKEFAGKDFLASIVVVLVALPLCMGIAVASGVPPALGLITGIIGGILVGFLAGAPLQVSGPAAGLAIIILEIVETYGLAMMGIIVLMAGILQIIAGLLHLGQWFRAVSPSVIHGMLAGIGILIFSSQFHVMVDDRPKGSGLSNLISIPEAIWKGIIPLDGSTHHRAALVGALTIVVIILWNFFAKKIKIVPAPLVAVIFAMILANVLDFPIKYVQIPNSFGDVVQLPSLAIFSSITSSVIVAAISVAFIASAETLLCAVAVDQMHSGPRTNYDRELIAQGVGNSICGFLGSIPMTGVIVRSSANVEAGGKTRLSAILHGVWILAFVLVLPGLLQKVPTASLAAILVFTGYKLVNINKMKELLKYGKSEFGIYLATMIAIVCTNLLEGVIIGFVLSIVKLIYVLTRLDANLEVSLDKKSATLVLQGSATFMKIPQLATLLEKVPAGSQLYIFFRKLDYIDHACLDLLMNWEKQHQVTGGEMTIEWEELEAKFHMRRPTGPLLLKQPLANVDQS